MVSKAVKAFIIIACIATGTIAFMLAPIMPTKFIGAYRVDYSGSVNRIDLVVNTDISSVLIQYSNDLNADLINVNYTLLFGHSMFYSPHPPTVDFSNTTAGNALIATLNLTYGPVGFATPWATLTTLTINPNLISNLTIITAIGNIELDTTNFLNKTFTKIDLKTDTGNIDVHLINQTSMAGDLTLIGTTGKKDVVIGENSVLGGNFHLNGSTGNSQLILMENVELNNDFIIKTTTGNLHLFTYNLSLNNNEIIGHLQSTSGDINANIRQLVDPSGNLTLNYNSGTGNARLTMKLEADYISSEIHPITSTGTVIYGSHPGYNRLNGDLISLTPDHISNFNLYITTSVGNINLYPERS